MRDTGIDKTKRYGRGSDQSSKQNKTNITHCPLVSQAQASSRMMNIDRWPMVMEIKSKTETKRKEKRNKKTLKKS